MIHGELTTLRAIERTDLDDLWRWHNTAAAMYFWAEPYATMSREDLEQRYHAGMSASTGRTYWLLITVRDEQGSGRPIGRIGYVDLDRRNRHTEIALMIGEPEFWGRGFGSDALLAFLGYLFHELNMHKVWLRVEAFNERAQRAYRKCGFQDDGRYREHTFLGGRYYDSLLMSITEDEFRAAHPFVPPEAQ